MKRPESSATHRAESDTNSADDDQSFRKPTGRPSFLETERASFGHALRGIGSAIRSQRHLQIQIVIAILVIALGFALRLSPIEWAIVLIMVTFVLTLELINTVVEGLVDLISPGFHPLAKVTKDMAAGAVLVAAIGALAVGAMLFVPKLWGLLDH